MLAECFGSPFTSVSNYTYRTCLHPFPKHQFFFRVFEDDFDWSANTIVFRGEMASFWCRFFFFPSWRAYQSISPDPVVRFFERILCHKTEIDACGWCKNNNISSELAYRVTMSQNEGDEAIPKTNGKLCQFIISLTAYAWEKCIKRRRWNIEKFSASDVK